MTETTTVVGSKSKSLTRADWKKGLIGLAMAVIGAVVAGVSTWVSGTDFGPWTLGIAAATSYLVNMARKWITDNSGTTTTETKVTE